MSSYWKRSLRDIAANKFLNTITILTIALSVLIVSSFGLLAMNLTELMDKWRSGVRILVYLKPDTPKTKIPEIENRIRHIRGVSEIKFIDKEEGLHKMKERMRSLEAVLKDLNKNPLPDAFEVAPDVSFVDSGRIDDMVRKIQEMDSVEEVTYGKMWLNRFNGLMNLLRLAGTALGGLFVMAAVFIVANTIRLVLYSRQQEIEIMRLIGATDRFIKTPFYIQGLLQGVLGGIMGLGALYGLFRVASANIGEYLPIGFGGFRYFSITLFLSITACAMIAGWIGCFLSLKGFLKH